MLSKQKRQERRCKRNSYKVKHQNMENGMLPRVVIYRSNKNIICQVVDIEGNTLVDVRSYNKEVKDVIIKDANAKTYNKLGAAIIGKIVAEKMKEKSIDAVVYDRRSYQCHGRVAEVFTSIQKEIK